MILKVVFDSPTPSNVRGKKDNILTQVGEPTGL